MATQKDNTGSDAGAPEGVTTLDQLGRLPESGPSDTENPVSLVSPDGTKVTVPERMVDGLKSQGYKASR